MAGMNPFEQPPTTPPVSLDPPAVIGHGGPDGPRRGRMALAALAAAGLVGGGLVVAGQFASADRPSLEETVAVGDDTSTTLPDDDTTGEPGDDRNDGSPDERDDEAPTVDGQIVIDVGDGEPTVIDLGELEGHVTDLSECLGGPMLGGGRLFDLDLGEIGPADPEGPFGEEFEQRMEEFLDELPWDELGDLDLGELDDGVRIFGSGGSTVTVVGPDGVEVIDLGEGDATVTIEQTDGELTIEADGDATVSELPDLGEIFRHGPGPHGPVDPGQLDLGELDLGELGLAELLPFDLDELGDCLDELD